VSPLELVESPNGVLMLQSRLLRALGVPHAFTTRVGGVSAPPFDKLNLAGASSAGGIDVESRRLENHRRVLHAVGAASHRWLGLHLVHGIDVVVCNEPPSPLEPGDHALAGCGEGDALCTSVPGWMLKVTTADCVAILLACPTAGSSAGSGAGAVAVVHAGWRGVVGGIVRRTAESLVAAGASMPRVAAAIGPCIGVEAFEVGEEVAARFEDAGLGSHVHRSPAWGRPHVDLFGAVASQLVAAGVTPDAIDGEALCTAARPELFFSHRRDRGRTGRMAAMVAVAE